MDRQAFRTAMGRFPSGVTVATAREDDGTPRGFTANAFCSVSENPPLILVCLAETADSHRAFSGCERFAVSVLRADQADVARLFATRGAEKFAGDRLRLSAHGLPVVDGAVCVLECTVHDRHPAGDHSIVVGRVERLAVAGGEPLLYHDSTFRNLPGSLSLEAGAVACGR